MVFCVGWQVPRMSTDGKIPGKLVLDPFPAEPLDIANWFENQSRKANKCTLIFSNSKMSLTRYNCFFSLPFLARMALESQN
jgi:hypothetical protein